MATVYILPPSLLIRLKDFFSLRARTIILIRLFLARSVTSKKLPNVYKTCPKMIS